MGFRPIVGESGITYNVEKKRGRYKHYVKWLEKRAEQGCMERWRG